ncbi:MAG TPA: STAS domain-containing protein [Acidimicrobiales bacterium]
MFDIDVDVSPSHTICRPAGELDAFTVGQLRERVAELEGVTRLVLDLSGVPFMDSAGLGALIGTIRSTRDAGGQVVVVAPHDDVRRLLHTAGFDRIVTVTGDVDTAVAELTAG